MATLEELAKKIESAEDLQSVVKTMKTIAAVNIRQFEKAVESLQDYNRAVEMGLQVALKNKPKGMISRRGESWSFVCAIVFGSDQGMCGQFNEQVASYAVEHLRSPEMEGKQRHILAVGERVVSSLEVAGQPVERRFSGPGSTAGITPLVQDLLMSIEAWGAREALSRVLLFHNRPLSGSAYEPRRAELLPMDARWLQALADRPWPSKQLPMFSMDWNPLFSSLVRQYLFVAIYRACAESMAAENASRIASMQAAEKNIEERLEQLRAGFRHERQRTITEELFDIISGFEALSE